MEISANMVKELRQSTGAGILDCKKALEQHDGDFEKAVEYLREKGLAKAANKTGRATKEGLVEAYVHPGGRMGSMIEVTCETDFVARTSEFKELVHDLAMQVVASRPLYVRPEDVPEDVLEKEKAIYRVQVAEEGKPPQVVDRIIEGKVKKFYEEVCLINQPCIKDGDKAVEQMILEMIARLGENIVVKRFVRFELGEGVAE